MYLHNSNLFTRLYRRHVKLAAPSLVFLAYFEYYFKIFIKSPNLTKANYLTTSNQYLEKGQKAVDITRKSIKDKNDIKYIFLKMVEKQLQFDMPTQQVRHIG
jgi:hypothetical protein